MPLMVLLLLVILAMVLTAPEMDTVDGPDAADHLRRPWTPTMIHGMAQVTLTRGRHLRLRRALRTRRQGNNILDPLTRFVHHIRSLGRRGTHQ